MAPRRSEKRYTSTSITVITATDIAQRSKLIQISSQKVPPRQEVLDELIEDHLKVQLSKRYIAEGKINIMPEVLVTGGSSLDGLAATLMRALHDGKIPLQRTEQE